MLSQTSTGNANQLELTKLNAIGQAELLWSKSVPPQKLSFIPRKITAAGRHGDNITVAFIQADIFLYLLVINLHSHTKVEDSVSVGTLMLDYMRDTGQIVVTGVGQLTFSHRTSTAVEVLRRLDNGQWILNDQPFNKSGR